MGCTVFLLSQKNASTHPTKNRFGSRQWTRRVQSCIPTRRVGTRETDAKMQKLVDVLEALDVQEVYTNAIFE